MHRFDLKADELVARRARRELEGLDYDFDEDTVELLKLAVSELVTNALRHSDSEEIVLYVRVGPPTLLVKVCDQGSGVKTGARRADPMDEGGRGLFLVEELSHSWGTSEVEVDGEPRACVWACFGSDSLPGCVSAQN